MPSAVRLVHATFVWIATLTTSAAEPILCPTYGMKICAGHGTCSEGTCACNDGFGGPDCAVVLACDPLSTRLPCKGHGACINGICHCAAGFSGTLCEIDDMCPTDEIGRKCSGAGICADHVCHCPSHRSGVACELGDTSSRRVPTPQQWQGKVLLA